MPPAVAHVWIDEPDVSDCDSCRDCRYPLPGRSYYYSDPATRTSHNFRPAVSFFDRCPICGSTNLYRIEDSPGILFSCKDHCYYQAGRKVDPDSVPAYLRR